jgi:threonyl-tRNA synthetase
MERFTGILIEHFAGAFPVWLAPEQARLIPVADRHVEYLNKVAKGLKAAGMRVEIDSDKTRMNNKIRLAQEQKIPYMLVAGDRDVEAGNVSVRLRTGEDLGGMPIEQFIQKAQDIVEHKSLDLWK